MQGATSSTSAEGEGLNDSNGDKWDGKTRLVAGIMDSAQSRENFISIAAEKLAVEALLERHDIKQLEDTIS